ncbi:MAG: hypothetical protein HYX68_09115 [Planctomycetes bacterium]|nr:hypothetical protein [Planctomycetota bacterium]
MKLHYLIVDRNHQLRLIPREHVEAIWRGRASVADFGYADLTELRLISVMCDSRLVPRRIYLLRMALTDGWFTRQNFRTLRSYTMPSRVTASEVFQHHSEGWPSDFFTQLAVAFDVPRHMLDVPFGIGGPLLVAAALRVSPRVATRLLK